jgi:hypothetical protein
MLAPQMRLGTPSRSASAIRLTASAMFVGT